jgi:hypothetical protein
VRRDEFLKSLKATATASRVTDFLAWCTAVESRYIRMRYAMLFYSLLFTFVASPILGAFHVESTPLHFLLALNMMLALAPIRTVSVRRALVGLIIVAFVMRLLASQLGNVFSSAMTIWTFVGLLAAANALRSVLVTKSIRSEEIYAALSAYLLAGISFGIFYWAVERAWPGSLMYGGAVPKVFSQSNGIYFSFVTLATLGYGDFVPVSDVTRGLAIVEAVAGQMYLGVMVARLVSLYVAGAGQQQETASKKQEAKSQ